ncbi:MAG: STAS domain-containing protein [Algicola sp.]|nr:STAS domain-containing protein [Algicola sp.]
MQDLKWAKNNKVMTVTINGAFNAHLVQAFRKVFLEIEGQDTTIVIDLADAEYIDSAALGLMIHMKKKFKDSNLNIIKIINSNDRILKVFQIMCFHDMFEIG